MRRRELSLKHFDLEIEATTCRQNAKCLRGIKQEQEQMANMNNQSFGQMDVPLLTYTSIPCIVKLNFGAENFELKSHLIQMFERNQLGGHTFEIMFIRHMFQKYLE